MAWRRWILAAAVVASAGCGRPESGATWLEGLDFGWTFFNHRVSRFQVQVLPDEVHASIIGGTSTTSVVPGPLPDGCDTDTCDEFPFTDTAELAVHWARATSTAVSFAPASVDLVVGADGASADAVATLERPRGDVVAVITGLSLDTDEPLEGDPACYRPEYGWHPRALAVELGAPSLDGDVATVPVAVTFEAGDTLDPERQCIDDVNDRARVRATIDLLVVAGRDIETADVTSAADFLFSGDPLTPEEQTPPEARPLPWDDDGESLFGWSSIDFRFNEDSGDQRGAYLRTLGLSIEDGAANGVATNYSPGTQLWPFTYTFEGTVTRVGVDVPVERGTVEDVLATVDDADAPILHVLEL